MFRCEFMLLGCEQRVYMYLCEPKITPETIDVLTMEKDVQCDDCLFQIVNIEITIRPHTLPQSPS